MNVIVYGKSAESRFNRSVLRQWAIHQTKNHKSRRTGLYSINPMDVVILIHDSHTFIGSPEDVEGIAKERNIDISSLICKDFDIQSFLDDPPKITKAPSGWKRGFWDFSKQTL